MNDRSDKPASPTQMMACSPELAPPDYRDPVIEAYKKDVDRTLLRQNLALSVEEPLRKAEALHASLAAWRGASKRVAGIGEEAAGQPKDPEALAELQVLLEDRGPG